MQKNYAGFLRRLSASRMLWKFRKMSQENRKELQTAWEDFTERSLTAHTGSSGVIHFYFHMSADFEIFKSKMETNALSDFYLICVSLFCQKIIKRFWTFVFLIIFCCNVYYVIFQEQVDTTFQIHNISFEDPFIVGSWCAKYFLVLHDMIMYIFQTFKDNFHFRCSISWFLFSPYHFVLKLMEFAKTASFESNNDFAYLRIYVIVRK